jgi:hypothetical protein
VGSGLQFMFDLEETSAYEHGDALTDQFVETFFANDPYFPKPD